MNAAKRLSPGACVLGARFHAVAQQLRTARCECGWPNKADCFKNTPDRQKWCWPCTVRWSMRTDAGRFVAPIDDVVHTKAVRRG